MLQRLRETEIRAPEPVLFCDDDSILGDSFFLMTHLEGDSIPLGSDLPRRFRDPAARRRVAERLIDVLAEIHSVDVGRFEDACDRRTPRDQVAGAVDRLDAATDVTGREYSRLRAVADWLFDNAPANPETRLLHGDFRPGNVLFATTADPEITGVLDWETAMLGDPLIGLGYLLLRWRDDADPTPSIEARYPDADEDAFRELRAMNERGFAPFATAPGSPDRRELIARYEARTGRSLENDRFYRVHAAFMLATVWTDLHRHRIEAGADSDWGPYIAYLSLFAAGLVDGACDRTRR